MAFVACRQVIDRVFMVRPLVRSPVSLAQHVSTLHFGKPKQGYFSEGVNEWASKADWITSIPSSIGFGTNYSPSPRSSLKVVFSALDTSSS